MHPGKRIHPVSSNPNSGFIQSEMIPGCYYKLPKGHNGSWAYITPDNVKGRIDGENVTENPDGTITVNVSIGENGEWSLISGNWDVTKEIKTV